MKTCLVSVKGEFGESDTVKVEAASLFDAANQAMQKWAKFRWFRPEMVIEVNAGTQTWQLKGTRVKAWREAKSMRASLKRRER